MANSNRNRHRDSSYYPENNRGNDQRNQRNRQEQDHTEWQGGRSDWEDESRLYMGNSAYEQYNAARESYNELPSQQRQQNQNRNNDYDTNSGRYNQRNDGYRSRGYDEFSSSPDRSEYTQEDRYNERSGYNADRFNERQEGYSERRGDSSWNYNRPGSQGNDSREWNGGAGRDYGNQYSHRQQRGWDDMQGAGQGNPGLGNDHRGKGPKGYKRSDSRIEEDINDRLSDDNMLDASDIEIQIANGEVILTGTVSDRAAKRRAEDVVEAVSGVLHVENRIRVKQQGGDNSSRSDSENSSKSNSKR